MSDTETKLNEALAELVQRVVFLEKRVNKLEGLPYADPATCKHECGLCYTASSSSPIGYVSRCSACGYEAG